MVKNTNQIFAREPYEAPACEVLRLQSEGIVCASLNSIIIEDALIDDWDVDL